MITALRALLRRRTAGPVLGAAAAAVPPPVADLAANDTVLRGQRIALGTGGAAVLGLCGWWLFAADEDPAGTVSMDKQGHRVTISSDDLGARNLSEREWIAMSENRLTAQDNQLRRMQGQGDQIAQLQQQIDALRAENSSMAADGTRVFAAYEDENKLLKQQLAAAQGGAGRAETAGPTALYGPGGPAAYQPLPGAGGAGAAPAPPRSELKVLNFQTSAAAPQGTARPAERGNTVFTDSPNYLPANSYAKARVIVGVDAASNVQSQADPLPVVLRITGPARSVANGGKVLTTRIEGCLVNGAARGDLSAEKVYVRLARMTCPQPGGRFAESEVKGFIAFGGKTGVRGRVVSREGNLTAQAFLAGLVGGIGKGFSVNTQSYLGGAATLVNGQRAKLSPGEIAQGGLGEGVSAAGERLSQYLIERAEQYQPVIEMPTGIEVEIVFLEGTFIRN